MTYSRRNFIKKSSLGAIAASTLSINCQNNLSIPREGIYMGDFSDKPLKKIKAAFIGLNRGGSHLRNFATIENTEVVALCDLYENNVKSCLLYTSPSPRDVGISRMPSSA